MKKMHKDFFISVFTSGKYHAFNHKTDIDGILRLVVLNVTYTIASILIICLGVIDMQNGRIEIGLIQLILGFMIFLNLMLLRTEFPYMVGGIIVTIIFGVFCAISVFARSDLRGMDALWVYIFPIMSIYALGLRAGLIPAIVLFFFTVIGTFKDGFARFAYTTPEAFLVCGVYLLILILTALYEYIRTFKDRWLAQQDSYLQMVFDNSPDIIMLLDKDAKLIYCAEAFMNASEIQSFEEIRDTSYRNIFSRFLKEEQLKELIHLFQTSTEEMNPIMFERIIDFGDNGNPRHYEIHFTPMCNDDDVFQGAFILFHDMTEIMEAKERTEQASRAKSSFLANMSHEIRTPLNAIIGMATIARDSTEQKQKENCLDKIESASVHLLGIINDILDMSKIEENRFELSHTEFEFSAMVQRVVNIFEFRLNEKKQNLFIEQDPLIPERLITDEQRFAQVITNLIGNAIKFTPDNGDITFSIKRLQDQKEGFCALEIRVTDTGIGIPKEQQGKLFQSFVQVDSTIARKFGGTGLGLAISKKIIELMNGEIQIESEEGKGASFIFTILAEIPAKLKASLSDKAEKPIEKEKNDFTGKRILLAEDVEINREIVLAVLEPLGIDIIEAEDGQMAFDLFCANYDKIDLVFMDIHMPVVNGYEASKRIRAWEAGQTLRQLERPVGVTTNSREFATQTLRQSELPATGVPIVAMTANVFKEDVEKCLAAGMNAHIGKPLDFDALLAILKKYLGS